MSVPMTFNDDNHPASVPSGPSLPPLRWLDASDTVSYEDGRLTMTAAAQMDWFHDPILGSRKATAPVLLFSQDGDVHLSAKATVDFRNRSDAGVLFAHCSADSYAELCFER